LEYEFTYLSIRSTPHSLALELKVLNLVSKDENLRIAVTKRYSKSFDDEEEGEEEEEEDDDEDDNDDDEEEGDDII
jgi:hypothetical protein